MEAIEEQLDFYHMKTEKQRKDNLIQLHQLKNLEVERTKLLVELDDLKINNEKLNTLNGWLDKRVQVCEIFLKNCFIHRVTNHKKGNLKKLRIFLWLNWIESLQRLY